MDKLYVMNPTEIALGYVFGHCTGRTEPITRYGSARLALEDVVRTALQRPPCGVAFSGGRDSSAILAIATHIARRDGLADPVPITKVFPNSAAAAESEWQELVIRHLGLKNWERLLFTDELDLVGPLATQSIAQHGVLWPPTIHADAPVAARVRHGSLLDGEGGDEVLGVEDHRIAPITHMVRVPRPVRVGRIRAALEAVAPARIRATQAWRSVGSMPWIRPPLLDELNQRLRAAAAAEPLSFAASVRRVPRRRSFSLMARNARILAADADVFVSSPFLHPDVVDAIAREDGVLGRGGRTAVLRALVPDLLPEAVLTRTSKASFGDAFWSRHARDFAETWTGDGVDVDLVDPDALQRLWRSNEHHALTSALLQQAWAATHRSDPTGSA